MPGKNLVSVTIPYLWQGARLQQLLHCSEDSFQMERSRVLFDQFSHTLRPTFMYREVSVQVQEHYHVGVSDTDTVFRSRILCQQLEQAKRVFAYIATCGAVSHETENKITGFLKADDLMDKFLFDQLAYVSYLQAMDAMQEHVAEILGDSSFRILCPGSVPDWGVRANRQIYAVLGGMDRVENVHVKGNGMIVPLNSTAGLIYETEDDFESCNVCMRPHCENRRAPYDAQRFAMGTV